MAQFRKKKVFYNNNERIACLWWLGLLESGLLKKGRGRLQNQNHTYCCLGVACAIAIPPDLLNVNDEGSEPTRISGLHLGHQLATPGWLTRLEEEFAEHNTESLASLNDGEEKDDGFAIYVIHGWSHKRIAAKIREMFADELKEI